MFVFVGFVFGWWMRSRTRCQRTACSVYKDLIAHQWYYCNLELFWHKQTCHKFILSVTTHAFHALIRNLWAHLLCFQTKYLIKVVYIVWIYSFWSKGFILSSREKLFFKSLNEVKPNNLDNSLKVTHYASLNKLGNVSGLYKIMFITLICTKLR